MKALSYLKRLRLAYDNSYKLDNHRLWGLIDIEDITQLDDAICELEDEPDYDAFLTETLAEVPKI